MWKRNSVEQRKRGGEQASCEFIECRRGGEGLEEAMRGEVQRKQDRREYPAIPFNNTDMNIFNGVYRPHLQTSV